MVFLEDHVLQQKMPPAKPGLSGWWLRGWSTVFQSLLFRRSFLARIGHYRTDLMMGEDGEFFFRALTVSPRVAFSAQGLTLYRLHDINKLTQDEGSSQSRRVIDWARCLRCVMEQYESCGLKMDFLTRSIFFAGIRKHLRFLKKTSGAPRDLVDYLSEHVKQMPSAWLAAVEGQQRLTEQIRLRRHGSRWLPAYQAGTPTEDQQRLIRELGFKVGKTA